MFFVTVEQEEIASLDSTAGTSVRINGEWRVLYRQENQLVWEDDEGEQRRTIIDVVADTLPVAGKDGVHPCLSYICASE